MTRDDALLARVRDRLVGDPAVGGAADPAAIRGAVARALQADGYVVPPERLAGLVRGLTDVLTGLGPVQPLLREPGVTDVLVNGPDEVWVERHGRLERTTVRFPDAEALRATIARVVGPLGHRIDRARPHVDARLPDGSRLHALLPPIAPHGPVVTIRRFAAVQPDWAELEGSGAVPAPVRATLVEAVAQRRAVVCCGRTGTGKTTLLGRMLSEVPATERVVLIEDAPELAPTCPHLVRLETRPPNVDGAGAVALSDLVRQALRMRPDRIVVGEVRGPEIADVLQALATGHEGCMTTVHARTAEEALVRLEGMALQAGLPLPAARAQLAVAVDLLVVLGRGPDGQRGVTELADVTARPDGRPTAAVLWRRTTW